MRDSLRTRIQEIFGFANARDDNPAALLERARAEMEATVASGRQRLQAGIERRDALQSRVVALEARLDAESDPLQTARITEELEAVCAELEERTAWVRRATEHQQNNEALLTRKLAEVDELKAQWDAAKAEAPDIDAFLGRVPPLVTPVRGRRRPERFALLFAALLLVALIALARRRA